MRVHAVPSTHERSLARNLPAFVGAGCGVLLLASACVGGVDQDAGMPGGDSTAVPDPTGSPPGSAVDPTPGRRRPGPPQLRIRSPTGLDVAVAFRVLDRVAATDSALSDTLASVEPKRSDWIAYWFELRGEARREWLAGEFDLYDYDLRPQELIPRARGPLCAYLENR